LVFGTALRAFTSLRDESLRRNTRCVCADRHPAAVARGCWAHCLNASIVAVMCAVLGMPSSARRAVVDFVDGGLGLGLRAAAGWRWVEWGLGASRRRPRASAWRRP